MTTMEAEVYEAFKSAGVADDKAMKAAQALNRRDSDVVNVKSELLVLKWMVGTAIALDLAILMKLFIH